MGSILAGGLGLRAQEQDASPVIRVDVDLVNVVFSVRKASNGELVPNLTKDDFLLFEDGKAQSIAHFSREVDLPFELGMLVDVSRSQTNLIDTEREAGSAFFSNVIRPHDEAFLLAFGKDTLLVQDFTSSVPKLRAGLDSLKVDAPTEMSRRGGYGNGGNGGGGGTGWPGGGGLSWPGGGMGRGGGNRGGSRNPGSGGPNHGKMKGTLLFDAIYLACTEEVAHKQGRKALLLITDGEDRGSYYTRGQAVESAQRADTILYSIYYSDPKASQRGRGSEPMNGVEDLEKLSKETGGRMFKVSKDHTLADAFAELQAEMRSQYSLAYKSTNPDRNGEYREIEIRPRNSELSVQAKKGYYATQNAPSAPKRNPS